MNCLTVACWMADYGETLVRRRLWFLPPLPRRLRVRVIGTSFFRTFNSGIGANPCFEPGTLVGTPDGKRVIEELTVGDRVFAFDLDGRRVVESRVVACHDAKRMRF